MRWSIIRTIWFREVRDQLRDRRTIVMLLILPLLLYPGLGMSALYFLALFSEQPVTVGVAGAELLADEGPDGPNSRRWLKKLPPLLEGDHFAAQLIPRSGSVNLLKVTRGSEAELRAELKKGAIEGYLVFNPECAARLRSGLPAAIKIRLRGEDAPRLDVNGDALELAPLVTSDARGQKAYERLAPVLRAWRQEIVRARMRLLDAPSAQFAEPFRIPALSLKSEFVFSRVFPFLIVMMSLTGALYPAIDVCAGEKERGTMETLLISPASRSEIVTGKFLTVWLFSTVSAVLNLGSLGFTAWQFGSAMARPGGNDLTLPVPSLAALAWGLVLLLPLAAFFSAVCVALAVYARSTKEGQYFLMPLTIVTLLFTIISVMPGSELTSFNSLIPITGASLLLQALMNARTADQIPWLYLGPVLLPLAVYCYLALHWAVQQFKREDVLFREAERLDVGLWLRRLLREKEPLPTAREAVACFALIMLLRWYIGTLTPPDRLLQGTAALQLAGIAAPALFMALLLTSRPVLTLRLLWPQWPAAGHVPVRSRVLAAILWSAIAVFLALTFHTPMVRALQAVLDRYPQLFEHLKEMAKGLFLDVPFGWQLLLFALAPAVCEELAFRGFILSGLSTRFGATMAIVVSSLLFAIAHGDAFRVLPTFALGIVLALLATRSGSLFPGMLFHTLHNGLVVTAGWWFKEVGQDPALEPWQLPEQGIYSLPAAAVSALLALGMCGLLLWWHPVRSQFDRTS